MKPYVKRESPALSSQGLDEQRFRDDVYKAVSSLNLKLPSSDFQTPKDFGNTALFTSGDHKAFTPKKDDFIDAIAGANITAETTLSVNTKIDNLYFQKTVTLTNAASVIFNGCRFDSNVTIASGGTAHFIGCMFRNSSFINNAGAAGNVFVIGCIKNSAATHVNTTIIAQTNAD
jgi:hypothetical protein